MPLQSLSIATVLRNIFSVNSKSTNLTYVEDKGTHSASKTSTSTTSDAKPSQPSPSPPSTIHSTTQSSSAQPSDQPLDKPLDKPSEQTSDEQRGTFTITPEASKMVGAILEAEVKRIVGMVKGKADIVPSEKAKRAREGKAGGGEEGADTSGKQKKPKRRRITIKDVSDVCRDWNSNVGEYERQIKAYVEEKKKEEKDKPKTPSGVARLLKKVGGKGATKSDMDNLKELQEEQEEALRESRVKGGAENEEILKAVIRAQHSRIQDLKSKLATAVSEGGGAKKQVLSPKMQREHLAMVANRVDFKG
eukprot:CAMPEP_0118653336 /NCGR_PEP_ID=MMETSP0785-20121206/11779_1 /TAXON_ID=91992 /ORGANISM="Bolidomonas pacifica, Strain CCMP 1866" /LENGTH=304 /DNA_ID=CAMNT_0006545877 /DNA_START=100 /DNA_END=1010 /DNA_ORIENTATION=-